MKPVVSAVGLLVGPTVSISNSLFTSLGEGVSDSLGGEPVCSMEPECGVGTGVGSISGVLGKGVVSMLGEGVVVITGDMAAVGRCVIMLSGAEVGVVSVIKGLIVGT